MCGLPKGLFSPPEPGGGRNPLNQLMADEVIQRDEVARVFPIDNWTVVVVPRWGPDVVLSRVALRKLGY